MRATLVVPSPSDPTSQGLLFSVATSIQDWLLFALPFLVSFVFGMLIGVAFTWFIKRRGWRARVISVWPISVMFGTLAYVITPGVLFIALTNFWPRTILAGLVASLFYTWPIWLVMGPVFFIYIAYLKKREKWLRDSTVVYLSVLSMASECIFMFWLSH
jgi:uncharacterized membrane protein YoaK (UPF0700 family)